MENNLLKIISNTIIYHSKKLHLFIKIYRMITTNPASVCLKKLWRKSANEHFGKTCQPDLLESKSRLSFLSRSLSLSCQLFYGPNLQTTLNHFWNFHMTVIKEFCIPSLYSLSIWQAYYVFFFEMFRMYCV